MNYQIKLPDNTLLPQIYLDEDTAYDAKDLLEMSEYGLDNLEVVEVTTP